MDKEKILYTDIFKHLIRQFKIFPEILFFELSFNVELLVSASEKPDRGATIIDTLKARSLVVSNLRSETKIPLRVWRLALCRSELSAVIIQLRSKCL